MEHLHKSSGLKFDCSQLSDEDITIIMFWPDSGDGDFRAPVLIDYYFGEYVATTTDHYIDRWLRNARDCQSIVEAYWLTNRDVLDDNEYEERRSQVKRTLATINYTMEVFNNEN